ncbi:uncharacterized protein LOC8288967 isoform X2 [Ricinus communis]|uniref:Uncharacterized protein n=1 Tax=Ricinus communis TaxID=3988 RepID=B9S4G3_RICCO|nr:uncharacterized protein LOC8288967 isoform X2 [Ricinus communis]EEF41591.1 conserved hypothetical protein [Ricinus communis]|eukprot:XP_002520882.1 uncharacterized protein LOC8288967 isoform X2 [Ricinus communis]
MKNQGDLGLPGSDSKVIGEKRISCELGEKQESALKRIKMRDLNFVLRSQETSAHHLKIREAGSQNQLSAEISQVTNVPVTLDLSASQVEISGKTAVPVEVNPGHRSLDLNSEACIANVSPSDGSPKRNENYNKVLLLKKHDREHDERCVSSGGIGLDLNEDDVSSSMNQDSSKNQDQLKLRRDLSECGSTTGPVEGKDPLKVWTEMKQNGFLSSSHGGISFQSGLVSSSHGGIPMPKQRGRKNKNDVLKKRMELAKKEQVDRFTKIAAPSGLLNGLNPGIINHVRNKKQVHSIIEALVRSEKVENGHVETKQETCVKTATKEISNMIDSGIHRLNFSQGIGGSSILSGSKQIGGYHILGGEGDFSMIDKVSGKNSASHSTHVLDGDTIALKLSTSTKASEESSTFSNEESTNGTSISSLSVRAASVASQWLELLHQDIKGRLSALRRSKKRVGAVIKTELPFLISKEFPSNQENDPYIMKHSSDGLSNNTISAMHQARWTTLFHQMDKALSEEEKQLESWLNQVKEMQLHCDQGLQNFLWNPMFGFQQQETSENYTRIGKADSTERELAVRAAAASIYSTCSLLMSKENVSCF